MTKYIFFDSSILVDCAFTEKEGSPDLLEKLFAQMKKNNVLLVVPEVIEYELDSVIARKEKDLGKELADVNIALNTLPDKKSEFKNKIRDLSAQMKDDLRKQALEVREVIAREMHNPNFAAIIPLSRGCFATQ